MAKSKNEERKRKLVSAKNWVEKHETAGGRTTLKNLEGVSLISVKQAGTRKFDIVPYEVGKGNPYAEEGEIYFERTYFTHARIGADPQSYVCLSKTFKKPCPICEHRFTLMKSPKNQEELIKSLAIKERQLFNVLDRDDRDKGVQVWEYSWHLFGKFLKGKIENQDDDDNYHLFADPEKGMTLKIGFSEEKGAGFTYYNGSDIEFKPRGGPLSDEVLNDAHCLDNLIKETSYEELKKIFLQMEDKEATKSDAPSKKPKPKDDDEEEDQEDEKDEEEDEEEDGEDSKEDSEEDDEDEAPARSKKVNVQVIKVGDFVEHKGEECEVKKVSPDGTSLTLEGEDGDTYRAVSPDEVEKIRTKDDEEEETKKNSKKPVSKKDEDEDEEEQEEVQEKKKRGRPKKNK